MFFPLCFFASPAGKKGHPTFNGESSFGSLQKNGAPNYSGKPAAFLDITRISL